MQGQFVWYDLMTTDVDAAKRFYSSLAGWSTQRFEYSTPDNPYTMWTQGGDAIGGVMPLAREQRERNIPPHWITAVEVTSVDGTVRTAESLGGRTIAPPMDIPSTGRYALIQDPQGAMIAVFSPAQAGPMKSAYDGTNKVGRMSWNELMTTDYRRAFDFYRQLFGWEKVQEMDMGGGIMYLTFGLKGKMYGGMYNRMPEMAGVPPFWLPYIYVNDVTKSAEAAKRAGANVVNGPMDIPGGSIVVLGDPQGAAIALHAEKTLSASRPTAKKTTAKRAGARKAKKAAPKRAAKRARSKAKKKSAMRKPARKATKRRPAKKAASKRSRRPMKRGGKKRR